MYCEGMDSILICILISENRCAYQYNEENLLQSAFYGAIKSLGSKLIVI